MPPLTVLSTLNREWTWWRHSTVPKALRYELVTPDLLSEEEIVLNYTEILNRPAQLKNIQARALRDSI